MFETDDLSEASPATISRCGMVYMDPKALGYSCFFFNFKTLFPPSLIKLNFVKKIEKLYDLMIEKILFRMRRECSQIVLTSENNYIYSMFKLINAITAKARPDEYGEINKECIDQLNSAAEVVFVYSVIWSIGANTDVSGRKQFDKIIKEIVGETNETHKTTIPLPTDDYTYYDYTIDVANNCLILWSEVKETFNFNDKMSFDTIVVPTLDSTKYLHISKVLLQSHYHILMCGATGTGKSLNCDQLIQDFPESRYTTVTLTFSARTGVMIVHNTLGPKLKRRKMGVLGPENNKKALVFVDDLNMPKKEIYGAQPVLELLRQWYDHQGWYDMTEFEFKHVIDIFILSAMGLPGGGRSVISNRLVRHSNIMSYVPMSDKSICDIFNNISNGFYKSHLEAIQNKLGSVVETTVWCYNELMKFLLPIPQKSHYLFNLRDVAKVFQGMCNAKAPSIQDMSTFIRLWVHEMNRVFRDRLIDKKDLNDFDRLIKRAVTTKINEAESDIFFAERILFGDFIDKDPENRIYKEIENLQKLTAVLEEILEDYNQENTPMNLILFSDACEHISRICRIIGFPKGNALLMGVGGSGRQSCCKLANYVMAFKIFQIEITKDYKIDKNWKEDIKSVLLQAGAKRNPTTFLIVDTQLINDKQLEDINNILNTGDVPNIYESPDFEEMNKTARKDCQEKGLEQTPINLFNCFLTGVRKNIHMVLALSPMGENFRANLRNFPSLVNCTTIDYYTEWPQDALLSVARVQLSDSSMELGDLKEGVIGMFSVVHKSVEEISVKLFDEMKRHNYVTPTSYLELIRMYKQVLIMKREDFQKMIDRYEAGLSIIANASEKVSALQVQIKKDEPVLEQLEKDLTIQNQELQVILEETSKKNEEVSENTRVQDIEVKKIQEMNEGIQQEKAETEKAKEKALKLADSLTTKDIGEVSGYAVPPENVSFCMKFIVLLFDEEKEVKNKDDLQEWFKVCKNKLLSKVNEFREKLKNRIKEEKVTEKQYKKIEPIYDKAKFETNFFENVSSACVKLAGWVRAMKQIFETNEKLAPIKAKLAEGEFKLNEGQKLLDKLNQEKEECDAKCKKLEDEAEACEKKKLETQNNLEMNKLRLVRAKKLLGGLEEEQSRWQEEVKKYRYEGQFLIGNCIISSGMMSYGGPFDSIYRKMLIDGWKTKIEEYNIPITSDVGLIPVVGNKVTIEAWKGLYGLPDDDLSIENAIMLQYTKRWPLCIDPQGQANQYIKRMGSDTKKQMFKVMKATDDKISNELEVAIKFGKWVVLENVNEKLSPELEPILVPQIKQRGKNKHIKFGDKEIEYSDDFKFFMTTTIPNPHYSPETCVKICLINFAITEAGLRDQMLSLVVSIEKSDLEQERNSLIETNAKNEKILVQKEDEILEDLKNSNPAKILDEDDLINKLSNTKAEADRIKKDQIIANKREEQIKIERNKYIELAKKTAILFFALTDMVNIDHMYQYSLKWYKEQFTKATTDAAESEEELMRIENIYMCFLKRLYLEVCRTLFDKDKLLFSFNMTIKLKLYHKEVDPDHFKYLLTGFTEEVEIPENPPFVDSLAWGQMYKTVYGLNTMKGFEGFYDYFTNNVEKFKAIYNAEEPRKVPLPGEWNERLDHFMKLLVYKALRPDYINTAIKEYIKETMDKHFVNPPIFNIADGFNNSIKETPIIFIITPGSDPLNDLKNFTERITGRALQQLSLGQGQGTQAVSMYKKFSDDGTWLFFQNTHLYMSWMPTLEKMVEDLNKPEVHSEFRLFLTTGSTPEFPVSILQEGIKMTVETSGDVKQMMLNAYQNYSDDYFESNPHPKIFKNLLFGCALFHALLIDRKKFGPIGWTSPTYDFSDTDLGVTKDQLFMMLEESSDIQYKVMRILAAVINYGGRVTDDKDERFIRTLVKRFINPEMLTNPNYSFDDYNKYIIPKEGTQDDYKEYIMNKYDLITPELFGLHANADITTNQNRSDAMLAMILSIQPRSASSKSGKSQEDLNEEKALYIKSKVPEVYDLELMEIKYPTSYEESMNTVLVQEAQRYNVLINTMNTDLTSFMDANRGRSVMDESLELLGFKMMNNEVPMPWTEEKGCGFLSIKPLSNWITDLNSRIDFLRGWETSGTPNCFWMSGFFFPQAFLTGIKQNYARKYHIPIDLVEFDYEWCNDKMFLEDVKEKAPDGCYVSGFYLEGCRYDIGNGYLMDSNPRELYSVMPILWLKPVHNVTPKTEGMYMCPIYKTLARYGTLSTTGHSTNFVMMVTIPTKEDDEKWIKAGVAAFTSLKFD